MTWTMIVCGIAYFGIGLMAAAKTLRADRAVGHTTSMPFWMLVLWPLTCFGVAMAAIDDIADQAKR